MEEERYATGVLPGSFMTKTKPTYLNLDAGWYLVHEGTGRDKELGKQRCWRMCVEVNFYDKWKCWKKECHSGGRETGCKRYLFKTHTNVIRLNNYMCIRFKIRIHVYRTCFYA